MYLVVGCGLSGIVIAERIANILKKEVLIIEKLDHIGGNCYDYIDKETNILVNKYGAHLFHTNNKEVWDYINTFDKWVRWEHNVLSYVDDKYVPMPINITTVNMLCNENIKTTDEMKEWLNNNQIKYDNIDNSEKMAKSRVGNILYDKLISNYTYKQWGKYPHELNKEVLERIPIRNNFDTRYFNDKYQALPHKGYTHFFLKILNNPLIKYKLNTDFNDFKKNNDLSIYESIIYTGPIDRYFEDSKLDKLEYRSIDFKINIIKNTKYFQQNSVINYPEINFPFTRIVEYKHFLNQKSDHTIIVSETTNDKGDPYYPVLNKKNLELYDKYKFLAENEEKNKNVFFIGRLANYKYFNMDTTIENALYIFNTKIVNTEFNS
jgi:UDP-galactopyranose mutase